MADLGSAAARVSVWVTPVLLFSLPVELLTRGGQGLWFALLVVVAPLLGFLRAPARRQAPPAHPAVTWALALTAFLLLWANLLFTGDVARWLGVPRTAGVLVTGGLVFVLTAGDSRGRWARALGVPALLALLVPLAILVARADRLPLAAWSHAASLPAFRFSAESLWVTEGRPVVPRRGVETLLFEEEHRITTPDAGPLRILVNDAGRVQVQEWTLAANQSVTVRPGDHLVLEPGRRLRFEAEKRIPGAPASGLDWVDPERPRLLPGLLALAGVGLTLLGGGTALFAFERPGAISRMAGAAAGAGYVLALTWAEGWATYTASLAPELFLAGVTPEELVELPVLVFRGSPWGRFLGALTVLGGFLGLLASAGALRGFLDGSGERGRSVWVWGGVVVGATLAASWLLDPRSVLLLALGFAASTLAPLAWIGIPGGRAGRIGLAVGVGAALFLALAAAGQLLTPPGPFMTYPALVAAPVAAALLWFAGRGAG